MEQTITFTRATANEGVAARIREKQGDGKVSSSVRDLFTDAYRKQWQIYGERFTAEAGGDTFAANGRLERQIPATARLAFFDILDDTACSGVTIREG